ncbi:hypothetical protein [Kozakia baliensis]|uniref:Uncharacterized protein n=1 Tax=Kozakia baliensis TaxID=153496 RepID=A0A1D8UTC4_9PROT|nr:hypothetical protein [Kozakia baliensis]AOX16904.1 hypothetical protein A0U89_06895 [Kozakia baliensis]GBR25652.1 hypothetical protein AA0488_0706 [Kozakia baliensis NRIC 0488]GEL64049.1 hypothetical protein KBA01_13350 [Kozakia baliensis]
MKDYLAAGVLLTIVGGLASLVWFADRAGKNSASVSTSKQDVVEANAATDAVQAMAHAQASGPQTESQLLDRLDKGNA